MLDGMEQLTLDVSYLIPFSWFHCKGCFKGFPVIKYTLPCLKGAMLYVFALCGLIVFMVYWAITHSGPFQTSKIELYLQEVNLLA